MFAGFDHAGCVWAPEAIWNDETDEYYVYWSGRDQREKGTKADALRVYLTKTKDFKSFSTPQVWASLNDGGGGPNIIDSTIAKEGNTYYRFSTSDWNTVVDTATSLDGPWETTIARGEAASHGLNASIEGLTVYQLPDDTWAVMGDNGGYKAHTAANLADLKFTELTPGSAANQYSFDETFRHGTVMQLTAAEEARLLAKFGNAQPEHHEPKGLIAQYDFAGGSLKDSVGSHDLTMHGNAVVTNNELNLDGSDGTYAELPRGMFDGLDQMTISLDLRSDLADGNFFSLAFGQNDQRYYFLRARGGEFRSAISTGSWNNESAVTGSIEAAKWHHYDVVFDANTMKVYVDGALTQTNTELSTTVSGLGKNLLGYLGKSFYAPDRYFQGAYRNIKIFDVALDDAALVGKDQLLEFSLLDPDALKVDPIVNSAGKTVLYPVEPGTDRSSLAPTFRAPEGVSVSPASGTTVDLTAPVTYTLTYGESQAKWTMRAVPMNSPVLPGLYADPNAAVFGDTYYIYATTDGTPGWGGNEFYVWKSKDLVTWERSDKPFLKLDGENGNVPWATGNAWAPTIIERDGKYYFYFSGHNSSVNRKTIGVAVADSPEGPFTAQPQALIMNDEAVTSGQAIDPAAFRDPESGKYYLFWGNGNPLYAELADDMVSLKPGTIKEISGLQDFREAAFVNYRDGRYHLTYSIDDTGSENYRVGYATADSVDGPWTYRGVILEKDPSLGILGTGHNSVIQVPNTDYWYIVYHRFAIPGGGGTMRETTIDRLTFDDDGFMQKVTPTLESVEPQLVGPDLKPDPEPKPEPGTSPDPAPDPRPEPEPNQEHAPNPEPDPSPEPAPNQDSAPEPGPNVEPSPGPETRPDPEPTPDREPAPEPEPNVEPAPDPKPDPSPEPAPDSELVPNRPVAPNMPIVLPRPGDNLAATTGPGNAVIPPSNHSPELQNTGADATDVLLSTLITLTAGAALVTISRRKLTK